MNIDINEPKCTKCGNPLGNKGSVLGDARVVVVGSQSRQELERDLTLFRGSVCFDCKAVFCMECNKELSQVCPQCGKGTPPAYRKELWKLSQA